MRDAHRLRFWQCPIKWLFCGRRFNPFPMFAQGNGHRIRVWNDPRDGETLYVVDGEVIGPLYSGVKKASDEE